MILNFTIIQISLTDTYMQSLTIKSVNSQHVQIILMEMPSAAVLWFCLHIESCIVCILVHCHRNITDSIWATTNVKFLVELSKNAVKLRTYYTSLCRQFFEENLDNMFLWRKRKHHWQWTVTMAINKQNWQKHCKCLSNCAWKLWQT